MPVADFLPSVPTFTKHRPSRPPQHILGSKRASVTHLLAVVKYPDKGN